MLGNGKWGETLNKRRMGSFVQEVLRTAHHLADIDNKMKIID